MSEVVKPESTIAIVIGIEKYAGVNEINGPADDAVRFVKWLRHRGVPAGNIALHLSPTDTNAEKCRDELEPLGIQEWREAKYSEIRQTLIDFPANREADLLLVLWGGHGVYNPQTRKQLLLCADARSEDVICVSITEFIEYLQNMRLTGRGCKYRAVLIDACAEENPVGVPLQLPPPPMAGGQGIEDIKLCFLQSAALGQFAHNQDRAESRGRTGIFSNLLLEWLERSAQLPPDINALIGHIGNEFDRIRDERKISQRPIYFASGDWDGNRVIRIDDWPRIDDLRLGRIALNLLRNTQVMTRELQRFYDASATNRRALPQVNNLDGMLANLADMQSRGNVSSVIEFVWRIGKEKGLNDLIDWVESEAAQQTLADLNEKIEREKAAAEQSVNYLLIDIPAADAVLNRREIEVRHWFYSNGRLDAHGRKGCRDMDDELRSVILDLVYNYENRPNATLLFIELYMPESRLTHDAERWDYQDMSTPLGALHPLVVRWRDRAHCSDPKTRYGVWKSAACRIKSNHYLHQQPDICWVADELLNLFTYLSRGYNEACVGFTFAPRQKTLRGLLRSGAPFAFWRRCSYSDWKIFRQEMDACARAGSLKDLPRRIRDLREEAQYDDSHHAADLVVLWDDPDRNPLDAQLSNAAL
jgi:hypothetical protein